MREDITQNKTIILSNMPNPQEEDIFNYDINIYVKIVDGGLYLIFAFHFYLTFLFFFL